MKNWLFIHIYDPARSEITEWPVESKEGILVFHAFKKKSEKTPKNEIETARKRLKVFLEELENES